MNKKEIFRCLEKDCSNCMIVSDVDHPDAKWDTDHLNGQLCICSEWESIPFEEYLKELNNEDR